MAEYVAGLKRDVRISGDYPYDWEEQLAQKPGVSVIEANNGTVLFDATKTGVARVRKSLGDYCHIERSGGISLPTPV